VPSTLLSHLDALLPPGTRGRNNITFRKNQVIFYQGDPSNTLFGIEEGCVKLSVTCQWGKKAVIGFFVPGEWFGESCLARNQPVNFGEAVAFTDTRAVQIDRNALLRILRTETLASYSFITHLLARNTRIREDLVYNLLNSTEKRLARALCMLAESEARSKSDLLDKITQQTLAKMIGTTRQRVNFLMQRFRKLGFIENDEDNLKIREPLMTLAGLIRVEKSNRHVA